MKTVEQDLRDILEQMEVPGAQDYSAGELALLAEYLTKRLTEDAALILAWQQEGERILEEGKRSVMFRLGCWWADRPWRKQ